MRFIAIPSILIAMIWKLSDILSTNLFFEIANFLEAIIK